MSTELTKARTGGVTTFSNVGDMFANKGVQEQVRRALPRGMDADRMMRIALSAVNRNPVLRECDPTSVGLSLIRAAEMGLQVDGVEGHLVPFREKGKMRCQFLADYKGLCKLAYQSELVTELHAEVVREGDDFEWQKGTDSFLRWKPSDADGGAMTHAWALAKMRNGGTPFVVMTRAEIMRHKGMSSAKGSDFSPWNKAETEPAMWQKTALRALLKTLPRSSQLLDLLKEEIADEIGGHVSDGLLVQGPEESEQPTDQKKSKSERMAGKLAAPPVAESPALSPEEDGLLRDYEQELSRATTEQGIVDLETLADKSKQSAGLRERIFTACANRRKALGLGERIGGGEQQ